MVQKKSLQFHGVGRRKASVARVWLKTGKGDIWVNGKKYKDYFVTNTTQQLIEQPLQVASLEGKCDITINVIGGGVVGQAGAVRLGISRALVQSDSELRATLKKYKLLTVDSRIKERKKYGQKGARAKFQFVKR